MQLSARRLIELKVTHLLGKANITAPPIDVERIANILHIPIRFEVLPETISGFLHRNDASATIVVNKKHPKQRQRFTIAHEIAHFVLGHKTDQIHVDRTYEISIRQDRRTGRAGVKFRKEPGTDQLGMRDRDEVHANAFAAALLMPRSMVTKDMKKASSTGSFDDSLIAELTKRYDVSERALIIQLNTLNLTPSFLP